MFFFCINFVLQGILGLQLSGIVCSFCQFWASGDSRAPAVAFCLCFLSVNFGPQGILVLSCQVLSVLFVCSFWASGASGAPAVGYCLFLFSVNFGPQGILGLQLSSIACSSCLSISGLGMLRPSCQVLFSALFCLSSSGLGGVWGFICGVLSVVLLCQFRASGDSWAPAVGYCSFFLPVNFEPQGILGLQLSGIVCCSSLSILGLWGLWGSSCRALSVVLLCQFRALGDSWVQLLGIVCSFCLSISSLSGFLSSSCQVLLVLSVCSLHGGGQEEGHDRKRKTVFYKKPNNPAGLILRLT